MSIAIDIVETGGSTSVDTLVASRPSGTTDGDLLIIVFAFINTATAVSVVPSGWTLRHAVGSAGAGNFRCYTKIASSEPTTWTWTLNASADKAWAIFRVSGHNASAPYDTSAELVRGTSGGGSTSFANTITPTSEGDSLLLLCFLCGQGAGTASTYAITNTNPTWTERINSNYTGAERLFACASAIRTGATATGNSSATLPTFSADAIGIQLAFAPDPNTTVTPSVLTLATNVQAPTFSGTSQISPAVVTASATINAPTASSADPLWKNTDKPSPGSITNTPKPA